MKVAVLGAGAIGAYVGAALHRAGVEVHLIARGEHLAGHTQSPVCGCSAPGATSPPTPTPPTTPTEIGPVDHVFLGLKANSYAAAGPMIEPLLHETTSIIAAQNGIPWWYFHGLKGPYEGYRIESVDPAGAVTAALPLDRADRLRRLRRDRDRGARRDPPPRGHPLLHRRARRRALPSAAPPSARPWSAGGLKCPVEADLRRDIWIKLMGNIAFNPISALTRATMAGICRHDGTRDLVVSMMAETVEVARRVGCDPGDLHRTPDRRRRAGRRAQDLHAPGPGEGQAAGARRAPRRRGRAGRPHRRRSPHAPRDPRGRRPSD